MDLVTKTTYHWLTRQDWALELARKCDGAYTLSCLLNARCGEVVSDETDDGDLSFHLAVEMLELVDWVQVAGFLIRWAEEV